MDKVMQAALDEVNATRKTPRPRALADAYADYRVRLVEIRDEYDAAVAKAQGDAERARRAASAALATAKGKAKTDARWRRATRTRLRWQESDNLIQLFRQVNLLLSPNAAAYQDREQRPHLLYVQQLLDGMLTARGFNTEDL